jgi:hypothetical protein
MESRGARTLCEPAVVHLKRSPPPPLHPELPPLLPHDSPPLLLPHDSLPLLPLEHVSPPPLLLLEQESDPLPLLPLLPPEHESVPLLLLEHDWLLPEESAEPGVPEQSQPSAVEAAVSITSAMMATPSPPWMTWPPLDIPLLVPLAPVPELELPLEPASPQSLRSTLLL